MQCSAIHPTTEIQCEAEEGHPSEHWARRWGKPAISWVDSPFRNLERVRFKVLASDGRLVPRYTENLVRELIGAPPASPELELVRRDYIYYEALKKAKTWIVAPPFTRS